MTIKNIYYESKVFQIVCYTRNIQKIVHSLWFKVNGEKYIKIKDYKVKIHMKKISKLIKRCFCKECSFLCRN